MSCTVEIAADFPPYRVWWPSASRYRPLQPSCDTLAPCRTSLSRQTNNGSGCPAATHPPIQPLWALFHIAHRSAQRHCPYRAGIHTLAAAALAARRLLCDNPHPLRLYIVHIKPFDIYTNPDWPHFTMKAWGCKSVQSMRDLPLSRKNR